MTTPPKDAPVTTETHRDDPREWLARRISEFKDAPVTEAGRRDEDWDYVPRDMPLYDCIFECCITPVDTDHDAHVLRHLRRNGWDVTRVEAATAARSDEIDAAWAEAEAALPQGWGIGIEPKRTRLHRDDPWEVYYEVGASPDTKWTIVVRGPSLAEALRHLAARLRSEQGERTPRVDSEIDAT